MPAILWEFFIAPSSLSIGSFSDSFNTALNTPGYSQKRRDQASVRAATAYVIDTFGSPLRRGEGSVCGA